MTLAEITALIGAVLGTAGFVLGLLNYLRDRAKVCVSLQWNMEVIGGTADGESVGCINVTNEGRRPVYLSHACLRLPDGDSLLLLVDSLKGTKLAEGDPPLVFVVPSAITGQLAKHSRNWKKIRAQISSSTGKVFVSKPRKMKTPHWARTEPLKQ